MTAELTPHYSLKAAAEKFFPGGAITASAMRTAIKRGQLQHVSVGGRFLVTERWIAEWLKSCQVQRTRR